jgi:hypothetical protein
MLRELHRFYAVKNRLASAFQTGKEVAHWLLLAFAPFSALAQPTSLPLQSPANHLIDRLEILHRGSSAVHTDVRGYWRNDAAHLALNLDTSNIMLSRRDRCDVQYLANDNNEWIPDSNRLMQYSRRSFLKTFYKTPANLYEVNSKYFKLRINPMVNFHVGRESNDAELLFMNQRGVELRGEVDRTVFFYSNLVETQARFPGYVTDRVNEFLAVPGAGFFKNYTSSIFKIRNSYDFNVATAYVGFQVSRHIGIQLGHGQHFIGNGYRSMLLSDFANPQFFLKFSTRVWRLHYQNLFLELSPVSQVQIPDGTILPKKYAAIHYLSFKASPRFSVGVFEATVLNRSRQFEFQYLNPVIFYRTVEGMIGSPDNVLLGLNTKYNVWSSVQLYGQFLLDEFTLSKFFSGRGWWANKYSIQAGAKYLNVLEIDHLDLQVEYNSARPYTYAHGDPYDSYTHYNQPLAHPLGANFREFIGMVRYQPSAGIVLSARVIHAVTGENSATENWGSNPLLSYDTRVRDYDNLIGQGVSGTINLFGLDASWMFHHNIFFDIKLLMRRKNSADDPRDQDTNVLAAGIRMNLWHQSLDF